MDKGLENCVLVSLDQSLCRARVLREMENAKPMDMRSIPPQQLMQMKQQLEQVCGHLG